MVFLKQLRRRLVQTRELGLTSSLLITSLNSRLILCAAMFAIIKKLSNLNFFSNLISTQPFTFASKFLQAGNFSLFPQFRARYSVGFAPGDENPEKSTSQKFFPFESRNLSQKNHTASITAGAKKFDCPVSLSLLGPFTVAGATLEVCCHVRFGDRKSGFGYPDNMNREKGLLKDTSIVVCQDYWLHYKRYFLIKAPRNKMFEGKVENAHSRARLGVNKAENFYWWSFLLFCLLEWRKNGEKIADIKVNIAKWHFSQSALIFFSTSAFSLGAEFKSVDTSNCVD